MKVYAGNVRQLLALARSVVRDASEAEDVLQDVLVKLISEPERYSSIDNPIAFLRTCVRNEAIDHVRRLGRQAPAPEELLAGIREYATEEEYKRVENIMWLRSYLDKQPPEMQRAFIAYAIDGYTIAQVARQMGIPQDTLRKRFDAVKKEIRKHGKNRGSP